MKKEELEALTKGYEKVANSLSELARLKQLPEKSPESNMILITYNKFRDKADTLKMLALLDEQAKA